MPSQTELAYLLEQLDEAKFVRLFKYLGDGKGELRPFDLLSTELWHSSEWSGVCCDAWEVDRLFQLAYLPASIVDSAMLPRFVEEVLISAICEIKTRPELSEMLSREIVRKPYNCSYGITEYYFVLNVDHEYLRSSSCSQLMLNTFELQGFYIRGNPGFENPKLGWGSPMSFLKGEHKKVLGFLGELMNAPSELYIIAREGEISIVPTTHHGLYFASRKGNTNIGSTDIGIVSSISTPCTSPLYDPLLEAISEFQRLLNQPRVAELDIHEFLMRNPCFLFHIDERYTEIKHHVTLVDKQGTKLIPDFLAKVENSEMWDVIELKLPTASAVVRASDKLTASETAAHAIAQLLRYREFFCKRENRELVRATYGISPYEPCLTVVIGSGHNIKHYQWSTTRIGFPDIRIVSYDYLIEKARECQEKNRAILGAQ